MINLSRFEEWVKAWLKVNGYCTPLKDDGLLVRISPFTDEVLCVWKTPAGHHAKHWSSESVKQRINEDEWRFEQDEQGHWHEV